MTEQLPAPIEVTAQGLAPSLWRPTLEAARAPRLLPITAGRPVTVIAPHPDDESLGAGGLLHRLSAAGCPATVVIVTDGAAGYPDANPAQRRDLTRTRRRETWDAIRHLCRTGAQPVFFDIPDGEATGHEDEITERIAAVLSAAGGSADGLVLAPWPDDPHPDHQAVGRAAQTATAPSGVELWQYPIWMRHSIRPDDPRVPVDDLTVVCLSTAERQAKRRAIEAHVSQLHSPFPGYGPVLPDHVLELFADGLEPFFLPRNP